MFNEGDEFARPLELDNLIIMSSNSQDTFTRATPISAISASKNYSILTPKSNNSDISTKNIVLKDVNFSQDAPNLNNKDFLNRLDEEIKCKVDE